ncbi:hypothetical protein D3C80_1311520 [compost metagenome]
MRFAVGGFRALDAVETSHDEIERLALDDRVADTGLEVLESRPQVELFVTDMEIKVDLRTFVFVGFQRRKIGGLTLIIPGSVGRARNGAVDAHPDFFAFQLVDRHDVDFRQKRG